MSVETVLDRIRRAKSSGDNAYVQATGSGAVKVAPAAPTVTAPASGVTASAAGSAAARDRVLDRIARSKTGGNTFVQVTPAGAVDVTERSKAARPDTVKIPTRASDVVSRWDVGGVRDEVELQKLKSDIEARAREWQDSPPADVEAEANRRYWEVYGELTRQGADRSIITQEAAKARSDYLLDAANGQRLDEADAAANKYYQARSETEERKLSANKAASEAFEDIYRAQAAEDAGVQLLAKAVDRGAAPDTWREEAEIIAGALGKRPEDFPTTKAYTDWLEGVMRSGELKARREQDRQAVTDSGLDVGLLEETRERRENAKTAQKRREDMARMVEESPFWTNAAGVLLSPLQGVEFAGQALGNIGHNDTGNLDSYRPLDPNDMPITDTVQTVRGVTEGEIENDVLRWLYENGMSVADSVAQIRALGPSAIFVMGGSSAANKMKDVLEKGGTNRQAIATGAAAGVAEMLFEYISIDKLLSQKSITGWRSWLSETAKQMGVEASEESFTEIANILSDAAIMGDNSDFARSVQKYTAQGMSEAQAKKEAFLDCVEQVGLAALGGAFSGGIMGGAVNAYNGIRYASNPLLQIYDDARSERVELAENNPILAAYDRAVQGDTATDTPTAAGQTNGAVGERAAAVAESVEGQNNSARRGENVRITDADEYEYMNTGSRPQIKAAKQAAVSAGEKIVLTGADETRNYIREAISGATKGVIPKAYGKVGSAMADDIYDVSSGAFDIEGWYLELVPSDLRHAFVQHSDAKQSGNIPLTEEDFLRIPDYIDTYDDVLDCKTFSNGEREIVLGKKINGYSVIVEIMSKSRRSLAFKNMWGIDTPTYEAKYKNSDEYRPSRSSKNANDSNGTHNNAVLNTTIPQPLSNVNPESGVYDSALEVNEQARRGALERRMEELNVRAEKVMEARERGEDTTGEEAELAREYLAIDTEMKELGFKATQRERVDAGEVSKGFGTPENHIDQRSFSDVSRPGVKAFQFDHPELHRYFVEAAQALMTDAEAAISSNSVNRYKGGTTYQSTHSVDRCIDLGLTRPEILRVCEDIIANNGQENYARAKKVELILDSMLTDGYAGVNGWVDPNEAYIAAKEQINGAEGGEDRYVRQNHLAIDDGLVTEEQVREEYRRGRQAETPDTESGRTFRNIGAAEQGFTTPTHGPTVPTQNRTMTEGLGLSEAERREFAPGDHEQVTAQMSRERAEGLFYEDEDGNVVDVEDTVVGLLEKDAWTGVEQDAAQMAFRQMKNRIHDLTPEQYNTFRALSRAIEEIGGTEAGRSLQARQKWIESGDGIVSKTMTIMDDPRIDPKVAKDVMGKITDLAGRYDNAGETGKIDEYFQIIREAALTRQTTKGASSQIKKTAEWAMKQIKAHGDTEFARNAARSSIIAMAQDQVPRSLSAQLKAARRDAMLSKISTWVRNVVSNNVFDPIDSIARDISVPMDWLLSKVTGTRSVGWDASWLSKAKWQGTKYGAARSFLEVALDINAEGAESRYGQTGNRTFKTTGNVFQRFMSQWEKVSNYAMYSTDQMQKGGIEAEVQHGIDRLYKKGKIADDSLRDAGAQEASFRTFQRDSAISKGLSTMRRGLNELAHVGDMGLGDILMPFVQVPANLVDITIDYSPLGFARGLYRLTDTLIDAHRGAMTAAQQARAVQTIGRSLTGTGVLALAVVAKMAGAFIISDDGRDEDKDKAALESQAGLTGTQINLSGLKRLFTGGSAKLQPGDTLMSISFMDPMNALLNMGGLIADDYLAEHEGEENGITLGEIFTDVSSGITQSLMDLPMMSPMADAAQAYQYSKADTEGGRWMDAAKQYAAGQVTSIIPNNLKGIVQGTDTKKRDLYSGQTLKEQTLDSVKSAIPGLRQQLPVKQNSFGEEMDTGDWWLNFLNNNILPGAVTQYTPQHPEITQWLDDLYSATGAVTQYPDKNPPNSISKETDGDGKAEKFALNAEEKRQYQRTYGGIYEDLVGQIVDSQSMAFTPDELLDIMSGIKSYAGSQAKQEFYDERDVDTETSTNFITKAVAGVQEAGIPFVTYLDFWAKKGNLEYEVDEKGNRKVKEAVVELIDSMDLTPEQKDWLYLDAGYAKDSIGDTPWH